MLLPACFFATVHGARQCVCCRLHAHSSNTIARPHVQLRAALRSSAPALLSRKSRSCFGALISRSKIEGSAIHTLLQVILIVIAFGFPFAPGYSAAAVGVFSAMPWALLSKGVQDLADASQGELLFHLRAKQAPCAIGSEGTVLAVRACCPGPC